jgi:hypothetical protein
MYAGSYKPEGFVNGTACTTSYSDGSSKSIKAAVVSNMEVVMTNGQFSKPLNGTSLTYTQGSTCPKTGNPRTFKINVLCDAEVDYDYLPYTQPFELPGVQDGENCDPYVNLISKYGCSRLDVN